MLVNISAIFESSITKNQVNNLKLLNSANDGNWIKYIFIKKQVEFYNTSKLK